MKKSGMLKRALLSVLSLCVCSAVFAADGVWTNTVNGNWSDTANWESGIIAGDGGTATINLTGNGFNINNDMGTVSLSGVTLNASVAGQTVNIVGGTNAMTAAAVINASDSSYLSFVNTTLSGSGDLYITGLGRTFLGFDNLLTGRTIISNGNVRARTDTAFGPAPAALVSDAIILDGGGLMNDANDANLTISSNRGITLTANGGYIGCGYVNAGTEIRSPITGLGFLGVNYEASKVVLGNSANDYSGGTIIGTSGPGANIGSSARLQLSQNEVLPDAGGLIMGGDTSFYNNLPFGILDLNGKTESVDTLASGPHAEITSSVAGQGTLIVGGADDHSDYRGTLTGGATIEKRGTNDLYLGGAELTDGTVDVKAGTIQAAGLNLGTSTVLLDGGDMDLIAPSGLYEYQGTSPNLPDLNADLTYTGWELWPNKGSENNTTVFPYNTQFIYRGRWNVDQAGTYSFAKAFDDGGYLEIDGTPIIHRQDSAVLYVTNDIAISAGWHDIELRYSQGGGAVGPRNGLMNGIMYDSLNGGFTSTVERARAKMFTDDGGPNVIATGRDNVLEATLSLEQDASLTVDSGAGNFVFAGVITTNSVQVPEPTLTINNGGDPVLFGSADSASPAVLDADLASSGGLALTNNVWLRRLPSAAYTLSDDVNLFLDGNDLMSGALILSNYSATIVGSTTVGGDGTATVQNGNTLSFSTLLFADGALLDGPGNTFDATNDVVLTSSTMAFMGEGSITYSGSFTGTGTVEKNDSGTTTLTGTGSSLTGNIVINDGTLEAGSEVVLGGANVTLAGGYLSNVDGGPLDLSASTELTAQSGGLNVTADDTMTINGKITGVGAVSKTGDGSLVLGGTDMNTSLDLTVSVGLLEMNKSGSADAYAVDALAVASGATATLTGSNGNQIGGEVTLSGGTLDLNGNSETIVALNSADPGSTVVNNGAAAELSVGDGDENSTFKGNLSDGTGALSLAKVGAGTLTMAAEAIAYTGGTDVDAGTLRLMPLVLPVTDGLSYQLDAVDPGTITLNGIKVTEWKDSSAAGVDFSQGNVAQQPEYVKNAINGLPAVKFSDSARNRMAGSKNAAAQTVFIVAKTTSFGGLDGIWGRSGNDYGIRGKSLGVWQDKTNGANNGDFTLNGNMYIDGVPGNSYDPAQPYILTGARNAPDTYTHAIGDYWNSGTYPRYFRGYIGEVLVYNRALSASERAAVESYLTEKWLGELPPGLSYRLDASDPSTITLDGSNVTAWADTTINGVNFAQGTAAQQPVYVEDAINGLPAVRFSDSARNRMYANKDATAQSVFIVAKTTSFGGLDGIWGQNANDNGIRADALGVWQHPGNTATWSYDPANGGAMYINGAAGNTYDSAQPYILNSVRRSAWTITQAIGDYWNSSKYQRYFRGYIGEVLVYNRTLDADERARVNSYLAKKWLGAAPAFETAVTPVTVAAGATLAVNGNGMKIGTLSGTGDLAVESGSTTITNYAGFTGTVTGDGTLAIASADGADVTFTPMSLGVTIRNDGAMDADVVVDGTGTNLFVGSMQDGESALGFVHSGSGTTLMSGLNSTYTGDTSIEAGVASVGGAVFTKYVRFSPLVMRDYGRNTNSGYQISEFQIMRDGVQVAYPAGTLASAPGVVPDGKEDPEHAIDGDVNTKFYINGTPPLVIELPEAMFFDGYRWYTANDAEGRDPVVWTVDISSDGINWITVDARDYSENQAEINYSRKALAGEWTMSAGGDMNVLSDLSATTVADPATLVVVGVTETVGSLSGDGDITLSNGTLGINAFTNATFTGDITGTGSIVKKGSETQSLSGALSIVGEIVVENGVLDLDGAVLTGITNIIIKTGGELTGTATVIGDLTVTFDGGLYSATLNVTGSLAIAGTVNTNIPEGETYPVSLVLFTYASADQATKDALAAATPPPDLPEGYNFNVHVSDTVARMAGGPAGTFIILR